MGMCTKLLALAGAACLLIACQSLPTSRNSISDPSPANKKLVALLEILADERDQDRVVIQIGEPDAHMPGCVVYDGRHSVRYLLLSTDYSIERGEWATVFGPGADRWRVFDWDGKKWKEDLRSTIEMKK
jgi:hypothetical protein